jgi:fructose-1,6-bisphosphatase/inositol monophosphatase family enzyme
MAWDAELQAAVDAARAGADAALPLFRKQLRASWKQDNSPVTDADRAADAAITTCLRAAFPDDAILTEESGELPGRNNRRWIVDPIDGTRDFLRGMSHWANLIALEADGDVVVGVLHLPATKKLYAAGRGLGAWRDGQRLKVDDTTALSRSLLAFGEITCVLDAIGADGLGRLTRAVGSSRSFGAPYGAALLLDGLAQVWTEGDVSLWDIAPFPVLLEEAGARFTDLKGTRTWPALHDAALALVRERIST